jgi:hypothetical protein
LVLLAILYGSVAPRQQSKSKSSNAHSPTNRGGGNRKLEVLHPGQAAAVNPRITAIREGLNDPGNPHDLGIEVVIRLADGDLSCLPALEW